MTSEAMTSEAMTSEAMTSHSAMMTEESTHDEMMTSSGETTGLGTTVTTAGSDYGDILFDGGGQAIYLFDKEPGTTPDCYGDCAAAWPPVLTAGAPVGTGGASTALLGTTQRTDGTTQVTYAGHPLYYYAHEGKNVATCHNVDEFGGLWLVVTPSGQAAAA